MADGSMPAFSPFDYQIAAREAVFAALREHRSVMFTMPTGTGKSVVAGDIASRVVASGHRVLILAHRHELITQLAGTLRRFGMVPSIEKGDETADLSALAVVASVQSMTPERLARFPIDHFGLIIADECHHCTAASYRRVLEWFAGTRLVGMTATPDRHDRVNLGGIFKVRAFSYSLLEAMRAGHVCRFSQLLIVTHAIDLASARVVAATGDINEDDLAAIMVREEALAAIVGPLLDKAGIRQTIVFAVSVEHAEQLSARINGRVPGRARAVHGGMTDKVRGEIITAYRAGEIQFLVNCELLTEGFDVPETACIAMARPTQSRALYTQMVGRGSRKADHAGKVDCLILDFVGVTGQHKLFITAVDLMGDGESAAVIERAKSLSEDVPVDSAEVLDEARDQIAHEEHETEIAAERAERRRQEEELSRLRHRVVYDVISFDALKFLHPAPAKPSYRMNEPATEEQWKVMGPQGVDSPGITFGEAEAIIEAIDSRRRRGLCSASQARLLALKGLDINVTVQQASGVIGYCKANKLWSAKQMTHEIVLHFRKMGWQP